MFKKEIDTIVDAFKKFGKLFEPLLVKVRNTFSSGVPATTGQEKPERLRLNLQFFAEDPPPPPPGDDDKGNQDIPTLKELFKVYPHLKAEHKQTITNAVLDRFKNQGIDFDVEEAKVALAEKKARDEGTDPKIIAENAKVQTLETEVQKLQAQTKAYAVEAFAAANGLDVKLLSRLAGNELAAMKLNADGKLGTDELEEVVDNLRTEFPQIFTAAEDNGAGAGAPPPPPPPAGGYNPGSTQRTNTPPPGGTNDDEAIRSTVAETLERLGKIPKKS